MRVKEEGILSYSVTRGGGGAPLAVKTGCRSRSIAAALQPEARAVALLSATNGACTAICVQITVVMRMRARPGGEGGGWKTAPSGLNPHSAVNLDFFFFFSCHSSTLFLRERPQPNQFLFLSPHLCYQLELPDCSAAM